MRKIVALVGMLVALAIFATSASGDCRWEWLCDEYGNCSYQPICDSTLDIPPPRPPAIQPIVPPSIRPIQPPVVPPVGTQNCYQVRRCDQWGNCVWDTVCY